MTWKDIEETAAGMQFSARCCQLKLYTGCTTSPRLDKSIATDHTNNLRPDIIIPPFYGRPCVEAYKLTSRKCAGGGLPHTRTPIRNSSETC